MTDDPRLSLRLHFDSGMTFGRGKADLLQAIDEEGSISAAGRRMGMSYRRAWSLVEEMNGHFVASLVDSSRGGVRGVVGGHGTSVPRFLPRRGGFGGTLGPVPCAVSAGFAGYSRASTGSTTSRPMCSATALIA